MLIAPVTAATPKGTLIYNPKANSWTNGGPTLSLQAETSWVKLPDHSVLTVDAGTNNTERYIPALNAGTAQTQLLAEVLRPLL